MCIQIEGYLTERKLASALRQMVGVQWIGTQFRIPNHNYRYDICFKQNGENVLVEFDGDAHYRDSLEIKTDILKDELAKANGYKIVRIPYWIQLNKETAIFYFGITNEIQQEYPHGFIDSKLFPASFCEMGIERFKDELNSLPLNIKTSVISSLKDRISEHELEFVLPKSLRDYVRI